MQQHFCLLTSFLATLTLCCGTLYAEELTQTPSSAAAPQLQTPAPTQQSAPSLAKLQRWQQKMAKLDQHFQEADLNKDGKISREEAQQEAMRRFDEVDTNKDNLLTREELQAHALLKKQQRQGSQR